MDDEIRIEYPYPYSLRVIGHARDDFEQTIHGILHRHGTQVLESKGGKRHSRQGKYVSITIQFTIESRTQLEAIYTDLRDSADVLMIL